MSRRIRGRATDPKAATNKMEAIRRLIQLFEDAGFVSGAFDAQVLLDLNLDEVNTAANHCSR